MERDFKWLNAVVGTDCKMCGATIRQGDGFYYEAKKKEPHCKLCGRAIRLLGYDKANEQRGKKAYFDKIMKMFDEMFGERW